MFKFKTGDIFKTECMAIIIPVNMMGVMGAGLAKQCAILYPEVVASYKEHCVRCNKETSLPLPMGWERAKNGKAMFFFFTKNNWKNNSSMDLIKDGLKSLSVNPHATHFLFESIAIPRIGCGLGKLDWDKEVKPLILSELKDLATIMDIEIYE